MLEYNPYMQKCTDDSVVQFPNAIYKVGQLKMGIEFSFDEPNYVATSLYNALYKNGINFNQIEQSQKLLSDGLDAEILRVGAKGWEKGKLRIKVTVEFIPDQSELPQPESPLDDLRQLLNQDSQQ